MKPVKTLTRAAQVGIYECEFVARIYQNMIVVIAPYVKWVGNSGTYAESRITIRDEETVGNILESLDNDDLVWIYIRRAIDDLRY